MCTWPVGLSGHNMDKLGLVAKLILCMLEGPVSYFIHVGIKGSISKNYSMTSNRQI